MTVSDEREENQSDGRAPKKNIVTVAAGVVAAGGVVATQLVWPWTADAIHDGVSVVHIFWMALVLSARRREP